ncbi:hypothetical protein Tco_1392219 [Tanacetum coccineum]
MAQLLQAPIEGYEDAIVIPEINVNFELKHGLINSLFKNKADFGHDKEITCSQPLLSIKDSAMRSRSRFVENCCWSEILDKKPRECLRIIESKSKVRNSCKQGIQLPRWSSSSLLQEIHQMLLHLQPKYLNLLIYEDYDVSQTKKAQAPAPVKAVEQSCVTCGGAHSYKNCPATDGNVYRDNIQEYVSQASAANFNQGNTNSRPPMVSNQIRPPGFPPIQNNQNCFNLNQGNNFNQNRGTNFNQNRGNNFYQGQAYQPLTSQPPVYQAQPYQAPTQEMQGVLKTDFENYVKANDVVLRNMQNQGQGLQNQMTNLTEMLSKFVNSNTASSSNSGSLPSNTVTNPKEDLKGITTRSVEKQNPVSEPDVAPVSAPMPNQKSSIPFPSRQNDERYHENANEQKEKFYEIFKDMSADIAKITRKRLKPGKHKHGNKKSTQRAGSQTSPSSVKPPQLPLLSQKRAGKVVNTIHRLSQFNLSVKSWGKSQLKDKKDNSGVKVHLGSNKRHSQALIGQYPSRYATRASKKAQGKGYFALIIHSEETQEATNHGLPRWQSV